MAPTSSKDEMKAEAAKQRKLVPTRDPYLWRRFCSNSTSNCCDWIVYEGIRGAIAQDQVLALYGTTADAFKSTDFIPIQQF